MGVMNADNPALVKRSFEMGVRHFDTASGYQKGRNEEMLGSVIKELKVRDQVIIATKIPRPGPRSWTRWGTSWWKRISWPAWTNRWPACRPIMWTSCISIISATRPC